MGQQTYYKALERRGSSAAVGVMGQIVFPLLGGHHKNFAEQVAVEGVWKQLINLACWLPSNCAWHF